MSDVVWPVGWRHVPLWSLFERIKDVGHPYEQMLSVYRDHGVIVKDSRDDNLNKTAEDRSIYQLVGPGWFVVNRMKAFQGAVGISEHRGIVSGHYICFRPRHDADSNFLNWLLRSEPFALRYARLSRGVRPNQVEIDNDGLRVLSVPLPELAEQRRIADFLDRETAKIDALIAKQQALTGDLYERHHGLVESLLFLGCGEDVHWSALGLHVDSLAGLAFPSEGFSDEGVRLLRGVNVAPGTIDWTEAVRWNEQLDPVTQWMLERGDIVLGMDRPFISTGTRVAQVGPKDVPALLLQRVLRLRARSAHSARYIYWLLASRRFSAFMEPEFTGVSVPHMSEGQVRAFRIPWPEISVQARIAVEIDHHADVLMSLVGRSQELVAVMEERRTALITAAVTGQIDVLRHGRTG